MAMRNSNKLTVKLPPTISSAVSMTTLRSASQYSRRQLNSTSTDSALGSSKSMNSPQANSSKAVSKQRRSGGSSKPIGTIKNHYYGSDDESDSEVPRTWDMIPRRPDTATSHDSLIFPTKPVDQPSKDEDASKSVVEPTQSKKLSFNESREKVFMTELPKVKPPKPPPSKTAISSDEDDLTSSSQEFSDEEDDGEVWIEPVKKSAETPLRKTSTPAQSNVLLPLIASRPSSRNHNVLSRKISRSDELVPQKAPPSAGEKPCTPKFQSSTIDVTNDSPNSARASSSQRLTESVPARSASEDLLQATNLQAPVNASDPPIEDRQSPQSDTATDLEEQVNTDSSEEEEKRQSPIPDPIPTIDLEAQVNASNGVLEQDRQSPESDLVAANDSAEQDINSGSIEQQDRQSPQPNETPTTDSEAQVNTDSAVEEERQSSEPTTELETRVNSAESTAEDRQLPQSGLVKFDDSESPVNASESTIEKNTPSSLSDPIVVIVVVEDRPPSESDSAPKAEENNDSDSTLEEGQQSALPDVSNPSPAQTDSEQYSEEERDTVIIEQSSDEHEDTPDLMQKSSTESAFEVLIEPAESIAMMVSGVYTQQTEESFDTKRETVEKPKKSALKPVREEVPQARRRLTEPLRSRINFLRAQALARAKKAEQTTGKIQSGTSKSQLPETKVFDPGKSKKPLSSHATQTSRRNSDERIVQLLFDRIRQLTSAEIKDIRALNKKALEPKVNKPLTRPVGVPRSPRKNNYFRYRPIQPTRIPKPRLLAPLRPTKTKITAPSKPVSSVNVAVRAPQVKHTPNTRIPMALPVSKKPVRSPIKPPRPRLVTRPRPIARPAAAIRPQHAWASFPRSLPHYMMPLKSKINTEPSRLKADTLDVYPPWK